ncbi:MAG: type II secretion system minor pseudopilin GspK [Sphingomonadaceae bacterium]
MKPLIPPRERGAALLAMLLLVAVMGALAVAALERMRLSTALAANTTALEQARAFALGVESLALLTIDDLGLADAERTTLAGGWNGATRRYPMPGGGIVSATVADGGNCFNLNSLVEGEDLRSLRAREAGIRQFTGLMRVLGVPEDRARRIAEAAADWADSDQRPLPGGAEDAFYAALAEPYRTGDTLFADVSELRAVAGMEPGIYHMLSPWLCALPTAGLSPLNPNTLLAGQGPLIAMFAPGRVTIEAAEQAIAARPPGGWENIVDFWSHPALLSAGLPLDAARQSQLRTRWFALDLEVEWDGASLRETALIDAREAPSRVAARSWGSED